MKKYLAEMIGTMLLVLMGCGTAVTMGGCGTPAQVLTVAFAFGMVLLALIYTIGPISGCHVNPAVTIGAWLSGRLPCKDVAPYIIFQVIGAFIGSLLIWGLIKTGFAIPEGGTATGANFCKYGWCTAAYAETLFTFVFVLVILGATDSRSNTGKFAGVAIGFALFLVHIACINITGTSVNPARSLAPAIFQGGEALCQVWVYIVFPVIGASLAALVWKVISPCECACACKNEEEPQSE